MTESKIEEIINNIDELVKLNLIFKRPISDDVEIAKVWESEPIKGEEIVSNFSSRDFYFIKNNSGNYVGAVYDMGSDLHVYILKKYRKKGYLYKAFRKAIFPYMKSVQMREKVRITIDPERENSSDAVRSAIKNGFVKIIDGEYQHVLKDDFDYFPYKIKNDIDEQRLHQLKQMLFYTYKLLYKLNDELSINYNANTYINEIVKELDDELLDFDYNIRNI